jgi:hypothetical protein
VPLTDREADLVEDIVRAFDDGQSREAFRMVVQALGVDISYRLLRNTLEVKGTIAVSPGAYFIGMAKQVAKEQGLDLGFKSRAALTE